MIRGWSYEDGKLIYNLLDNHTIALDAKTGDQIWRTPLDNAATGSTMTHPAFAAEGKVYVGNSGGEMGVWGWFAALAADTGKVLWRMRSTGSDEDVGIGPRFKPFYPQYKGKDLGLKTWPEGMPKTGGGAPWGFVSYDPELNLVYDGTSNPAPRVPSMRPGDNLWTFRDLCPRRRHGRGGLGLSGHAARPVGL